MSRRVHDRSIGLVLPVVRAVTVFGGLWVGLVVASEPALGHATGGTSEPPVTLAAVVALPVVAGLAGGALTGLLPRGVRSRGVVARVTGPLLVALGGAALLDAGVRDPMIAVVGLLVGVATVVASGRRSAGPHAWQTDHARLSAVAIGVHRAVEGLLVGGLYVSGASIGAIAVAGHAFLETAALGGPLLGDRWRAVGTLLAVQAGYVAGVGMGLALAPAAGGTFETVTLAAVGAILLGAGLPEMRIRFASEAATRASGSVGDFRGRATRWLPRTR